MKISAATVLLSISTASAFNVGYLNQLGSSTGMAPAKAAPAVKKVVITKGPSSYSYLDNLQPTPELISAIESARAAPASPAEYLKALSSNSALSGGGVTGYLDALPSSNVSPTSGRGMTSYLDTMPGSARKAATPPAPAPAPPAAAASAPRVAAPDVGKYLSSLASNAPTINGSGLAGYLDVLTINSRSGTGVALKGYLSALATNAATTSGAGLTGYLDALKSNSVAAGAAGASPSVTSFLENIYKQIMALPNDAGSKSVNGDKLSFATTSGPYAMSFIKM